MTITSEQREDLTGRVDDHLAAVLFHCFGHTLSDTRQKAEEIEARAFSAAMEAASTGGGDGRPSIQLVRVYAKVAAELLQVEAQRGGATGTQEGEEATTHHHPGGGFRFPTQGGSEAGSWCPTGTGRGTHVPASDASTAGRQSNGDEAPMGAEEED
eukprot:CAMPEP_0197577416 /NCGR_PEP_ID=MMETSP1326-20131121/2056_1 /TAXON_ID=1155430 /ORGANISM="Genus nov. species nov., Strain RCC2288" /LENGTH=155 /DNA_ID=CAMNT_0043140485 /DNA_START=97 /DNA_END=561 /DNA_ORIENTATION=-